MARAQTRSEELLRASSAIIPGGVNSPVRAFRAVGGTPLFIQEARGAQVWDVDGESYIDYVGSWGPMILGHSHPEILEAVEARLPRGTSYGAPTEIELELAQMITGAVPGVEMVRMVNSGTEATMSAVRLARGFTGREKIVKFNGCYHGHADTLLVQAGSGVATFGISGSPGVPEAVASLTLSLEFNDLELVERCLKEVGPETVAALIIEPVPGNMGLIVPEPGYLEGLRKLTAEHGILLIFDEVMSGFRVAYGGAVERYGVEADLVTFGKVIGAGFPVGAFGGRADVMKHLAPEGPVYQAGTLSGNPIAMAAGVCMLELLKRQNPYPRLEELAGRWKQGMEAAAHEAGIAVSVSSLGSMLGLFFSETPVKNYTDAKNSNVQMFNEYFHRMLSRGIYLAPSAFEAGFLSAAHTEVQIDQTVEAAAEVFSEIAS